MAWAKYRERVQYENLPLYDETFRPGDVCPSSGIYRCTGCGQTVVAEVERRLPPQNHHVHTPAQGAIIWQLLVRSTHRHPTI